MLKLHSAAESFSRASYLSYPLCRVARLEVADEKLLV